MSIRKHGVGTITETEGDQPLSKEASQAWDDQDEQALADENED